jgi:hypothetical protein
MQHHKTIDALVKQYAFKRKSMTPKHIETPKKPKEATLLDSVADSVDEGDGPSFTSYIGRGQNVDHDDESFWPYFISAEKRKTCSGTCICPEADVQDNPKPRANQFAGITLYRSNKSNQEITANI